jgi:nitrite reductase/ring-hydroxylating ferredoxin subunit
MPQIEVKLDQIPLERPLRLEHAGTAIVVIRTRDRITAFPDRCPHAHWPISEGEMMDGILHCPGHGLEFNAATGRCINSPVYRLKPLSVSVWKDNVRIDWDQAISNSEIKADKKS